MWLITMTTKGIANKKIGFIGTGKMGEALIKGIIHAKLVPSGNIYASDMDIAKLQILEKELKINICNGNCDAVVNSDVLIIAVNRRSFRQSFPRSKAQ